MIEFYIPCRRKNDEIHLLLYFIFITFAALGVECKEEKLEVAIQDRAPCSIENYMCERDVIEGEERRETDGSGGTLQA